MTASYTLTTHFYIPQGGLSLDQTELCILDYTHLDAKKRNLFQTVSGRDDKDVRFVW